MKRIIKKALVRNLFILSSASIIIFTSCAAWFEKKVDFDLSKKPADLSDLVVPDEKILQLKAPEQIFVSQSDSNSSINVAWEPVNHAVSYYLERAVSKTKDSNGNFILPKEEDFEAVPLSTIYGTSYTDTILANPSYLNEEYDYAFFYRVAAENPRLNCEMSAFTVSEAAILLAPPKNVKATAGEFSDRINLRWDKVLNAKSYDIYRSPVSDGSSAVKISNIPANINWYTNMIPESDQGNLFYYYIITKTSTGASVQSPIAFGFAKKAGAPVKVTNVRVTDGRGTTTNKITISWDASSGLNYEVKRFTSKDSTFTTVATIQDGGGSSCEDTKNLKPGIFYYYQVLAFTGSDDNIVLGPLSDSSPDFGADAAEGFILSPPTDISISKNPLDPSYCSIKFLAPPGSAYCTYNSDVTKAKNDYIDFSYIIQYSNTENGTYETIATVKESTLAHSDDGYLEIPSCATKSFYRIISKNNGNNALSNPSSVCAPAPFAARNISASKALYISNSIANANGVFPVKLTWDPPLADSTSSDTEIIGGYHIYRSTMPDSGFKKITEIPVTTTSYIDNCETFKSGIYYYYKVLSLNSFGQGANYSEAVIGYGALTSDQYMREYNKTVIASQKKLKLMHKPTDMGKLGSETAHGAICGTLDYDASIDGLGARILMHYTDYAEFYANGNSNNGYYFFLNGDTNTKASMDASGKMDGTVTCIGMYPGSVKYDNLQIKGGGAAGGYYVITRQGFPGEEKVDWKVGEEGK